MILNIRSIDRSIDSDWHGSWIGVQACSRIHARRSGTFLARCEPVNRFSDFTCKGINTFTDTTGGIAHTRAISHNRRSPAGTDPQSSRRHTTRKPLKLQRF
jgi:hypothetical protein